MRNNLIDISTTLLTTRGWILVGIVAAVISAVADVGMHDTEIVVTLESRLRTIPSTGISRWATDFVAHITAIARSIATKVRRDAVATGALKTIILQRIQKPRVFLSVILPHLILFLIFLQNAHQ